MNSLRTNLSVSLCELTSAVEIASAQRLRYAVWQAEGAVIHHPEREMIVDSHDEHACHWGVFDEGLLVAAARLCLHSDICEAPEGEMFADKGLLTPVVSMNRLVVSRTHRGLGIASKLDDVRIQKAKEWRAATILATPVSIVARLRSLEQQGFQFLEGVAGYATWSPTVRISACYLPLPEASKVPHE